MTEVIVAGAAIVRDYRIFVARRSRPQTVAGYWELPGDQVGKDEEERDALQREFTTEFSISLRCVDRILSDRKLLTWPSEDGETTGDATLRIWRCQLPSESTLDTELGEPRPNMYSYDESRWLDIDDLDAVGPWRDADRLMADEIADYYRSDEIWQMAD
ncbi:MAG TPA: NUDIX domain-containing protein [Actinophytocola sp.]|uniref:NUDIX domain-containing protein n=1 Tax=Actinophytocola sp. TaxID=1872138 RepID=UPI002DB9693D|nr:NUDIX domain-containing protein [Actinophytocola sp.]HEU5469427.1 NUDIX domain-containing protein [Actinophytocola sp.]